MFELAGPLVEDKKQYFTFVENAIKYTQIQGVISLKVNYSEVGVDIYVIETVGVFPKHKMRWFLTLISFRCKSTGR